MGRGLGQRPGSLTLPQNRLFVMTQQFLLYRVHNSSLLTDAKSEWSEWPQLRCWLNN